MKKLIFIGALFMLFGCGSTETKVYAGKTPELKLQQFLNGKVEGYGFFQGRSGEVDLRYYVQMTGKWNDTNGTLHEKFYVDDNTTNEREWKITMKDDNNFTATAADVKGEAIGTINGFAMNMKYTLIVDRDGSKVSVNMDDWIYLQPDGGALNRATMTKFGIYLGNVIFHFRKLADGESFKEKF
jgi:hypothetical protein